MKSLVIAEKPSVARDIARVLKCSKKLNGALEGNQYIVTWGLGHLVTLADPEDYDKKYKEWKMEHLPMLPKPFKLEVIKQTGKQFAAVKTQIHRNDVNEIIIATDAGREGELVARLILEKTGCKKPIKRLWLSSVTDKAIAEGFANLKDGHAYDALYDAAMCRAEADWLVGINATRALTCKYNAQLSCGRVQTPTLAIIAKREAQIKEFVPKPYYGLSARGNVTATGNSGGGAQRGAVHGSTGIILTWQDEKSKSYRSFDKDRIEKLLTVMKSGEGIVTEIKKTPKKTYAPLLYDLTELQRDANKKFGFSAKETLNIMQRLYENHKVLTYPRTDSRYLSKDIVPTLKDRLEACGVGPYRKLAAAAAKRTLPAKPAFVNDAKVSDHHAIIPTEQFVQMDHMTNEERKIYDLVVRRFISVFYPPFEYEQTQVTVEIAGEHFLASGKIVKSSGWKEVYETGNGAAGAGYGVSAVAGYGSMVDEDDEEEASAFDAGMELRGQTLPELEKGRKLTGLHISMTEGKTKPPAPFNEATLLSAMENPTAYMESHDKKMAQTLGETGGLGTVATRADIIEKLFSGFLLEKRGKDIYLTSKAKQLLELVPEELKKPELTAEWEMKLSRIAKGQMKRGAFMQEIIGYTGEVLDEIKSGEGTFRHDNLTNVKCPNCGKRMLAVKGKNSEMLVCQDRECGYRETVAKTTNARCPVCHKKMQLRGKGDAQIFVCACGHKEKLKAFQDRRKKEGAGVSKRDVQNYMKKQKEEPVNNAFADAFAKIKL